MEVTAKNFDQEVLESDKPVLVMFWGSWCPVCKRSEPMIRELNQELDGTVQIKKLNIDRNRGISNQYGIAGTPTYHLFRDGESIGERVGSMSKKQLKNFMKGRLNGL